jgi:hypothetical protein
MNNDTYLLKNHHVYHIDRLYHRYGSLLGVASCTFVRTPRLPPQYTSKVTCQQSWGIILVATPDYLNEESDRTKQYNKNVHPNNTLYE